MSSRLFFFNDTATTEIYTLSLHDALPISDREQRMAARLTAVTTSGARLLVGPGKEQHYNLAPALSPEDRKSTRLNSSHGYISYAVFCLKKKNNIRCIADLEEHFGCLDNGL